MLHSGWVRVTLHQQFVAAQSIGCEAKSAGSQATKFHSAGIAGGILADRVEVSSKRGPIEEIMADLPVRVREYRNQFAVTRL